MANDRLITYTPVFGTHKGEPNSIYAIQPDGGKTLLAQLSTDSNNNTVLVGAGAVVWAPTGLGGKVTDILYNGSGQPTSYIEAGVSFTVTYNLDGTVNTVSDGTTTRTAAYNGDGTVSSFQ